MSNEKRGAVYTFMWFIEKYGYCWHKNGEALLSPEFTFEGLKGTKWLLGVYPKGQRAEHKGYISLYLIRSVFDTGPEIFVVNGELSVLAENASVLHFEKFNQSLKRGRAFVYTKFVQADDIHLRRKSDYLPNDTLSVRCVMRIGEGDDQNPQQIVGRTRIITEDFSFLHKIENFSKIQENEKQEIKIKSLLNNALTSYFYFVASPGSEEKIKIDFDLSNASRVLHECKLLLWGRNGHIECGGFNKVYNAEEKRERSLTLSLTRQAILSRKSEFLSDDTLFLLCQCIFSTKMTSYKIEETQHELSFATIKQNTDRNHNKDIHEAKINLFGYPSALDDMKALYISHRLTDVQLKTKTKSFPAHKCVLCARSPVFEAMMTTDMEEKNTACIPVDDLEDDTVEQLLFFLYSDSLENLRWESASRLYYAAHKYQIGKLKAMCSSFLAENLNASNAAKLLLLSDTHKDSNLQEIVEDFIMKNEEQVFGSDEWEKLIETNPLLVIKTMHLKYKRKK